MNQKDSSLVERELLKLETALLQRDVRQSPETISSLLADEFCEFGASGRIYTKQDVIGALANESPVTVSIADFSVTLVEAGVALVTYQAICQADSIQSDSRSLRSSLWVLRDKRWQMLFHQGTNVQPLASR